jgi:hypothetical protein
MMNQIERIIKRWRLKFQAGLAAKASALGALLLAVSVSAQTAIHGIEAKTVSSKKEVSMTQIKKAPDTTASADQEIHPFRVNVPEESLADLRRRIVATRFPEKETVDDRSQGVRLSKLQELVRYWSTDYDWRKVEAKLNSLPQFVTNIDGIDIHFIHVRSKEPNALPIIITHG